MSTFGSQPNNAKSFYAYIGSKNRSKSKIGPLIDDSGYVTAKGQDMAHKFNKYFTTVFTKENLLSMPEIPSTFCQYGQLSDVHVDDSLLPAGCREAANCRYCFYSQAKNQVFRPAGATRCTDSRQRWRGRRARGSTWPCKISRQSVSWVGTRRFASLLLHCLRSYC